MANPRGSLSHSGEPVGPVTTEKRTITSVRLPIAEKTSAKVDEVRSSVTCMVLAGLLILCVQEKTSGYCQSGLPSLVPVGVTGLGAGQSVGEAMGLDSNPCGLMGLRPQPGRYLKIALSHGSSGVHDTIGNLLPIKRCNLLEYLVVL